MAFLTVFSHSNKKDATIPCLAKDTDYSHTELKLYPPAETSANRHAFLDAHQYPSSLSPGSPDQAAHTESEVLKQRWMNGGAHLDFSLYSVQIGP